MTTPLDRVLAALHARGLSVKGQGNNYAAQCPCHDDRHASLSIGVDGSGNALLHCHARCDTPTIVASLDLTWSDLFVDAQPALPVGTSASAGASAAAPVGANGAHQPPAADAATTDSLVAPTVAKMRTRGPAIDYQIRDIEGNVVAIHHRRDKPDGKTMWWSRPGVAKGLGGMSVADIPLYGTELLRNAPPQVPAIIVEGEKSAIALQRRSLLALGTITGAGKSPSPAVLACLAQRDVVLWPDNDDPGRLHMAEVARKLHGVAKSIRVVDWKLAPEKGDAADYFGTDTELGAMLDAAPDAPPPLPNTAGAAGHELRVFDPKQPLVAARAFVAAFYTHTLAYSPTSHPTLHSYGGVPWAWRGNRYVELEDEYLGSQLQPWLTESAYRNKDGDLKPYPATSGAVADVIESARRHVHLPAATVVPAWLGTDPPPYPLHELLPGRSATLHIPSGNTIPPTPLFFAFNALDYDYDPAAPDPMRWYSFLGEAFGDDREQIELLQEWFGYVLTANTNQHKILLVVGPPRSGKGTIARVLTQLVGAGNVAGPTVPSLSGAFGLAPLVGKSLAIIADARFAGEGVAYAIDLLKNISGEDAVTVNRKNRDAPTMKLPTRFAILANENPRLPDASAAIATRFLVLRTAQSFLGREDHTLTNDLLLELPGILLWAIDGWHRLNARGRFHEPASSKQTVQDIGDLSSPVGAFLREQCVVGAGSTVLTRSIYAAWKGWCEAQGARVTTAQVLGKDLAACIPGLKRREGVGREFFYDGVTLR